MVITALSIAHGGDELQFDAFWVRQQGEIDGVKVKRNCAGALHLNTYF
jgi:hypothetical protein